MSLSEEESNFLRFYFLNVKVASKAARVYFDSVHQPAGLANELAKNSATLRKHRFISKIQLKTLYPSPASNVRSEYFDTTLIVCLLRIMKPRESNPVTGWDNLPHPGDTSIEADLARIKWYRNKMAHHGDGRLSTSYFSRYWGDLECAIGRLSRQSLLREAQSVQHIVLDKSLKDILNSLHNLQMSQEQLTSIINDIQSTIHNQTTIREKHEIEIQQLDESNQRIAVDVHKLATEFSETKRSIEICTQKIEACRKEKEILQEKAIDEQEQLDVLTQQFLRIECTYDIKFKEVDERLTKFDGQLAKQDAQLKKQDKHIAKQDEQMAKQDEHITKQDKQIENQGEQMTKQDEIMATCLQNINDIRKTQLCTHNSSEGRKRKKLEDDTKSLIEEDLREDTFVTTKAVTESLSLLQKNGVLLITGCAGTGKSRIARHVLYMYYTGDTSYRCIKLNTLDEWENMVSREDNVVVLLDDIFGETNCVYNREKDIPILDKVHAYVWKGNIKVIITIRDTVKRRCQEVFDSHRLFQFGCIDLSSKKYNLSWEEKFTVLDKYMNIVRQSHFVEKKGFVNSNNVTILKKDTILKITNGSPVKGFPLAVYQFVNNAKYFKLGSNFFDRPTDAMLEELNEIRRKGNDNRKYKMQYTVMVYTAINENFIDPQDGSIVREVNKLVEAIWRIIKNKQMSHIRCS